jgi:hypothetical protein
MPAVWAIQEEQEDGLNPEMQGQTGLHSKPISWKEVGGGDEKTQA